MNIEQIMELSYLQTFIPQFVIFVPWELLLPRLLD